MGVFDHFPYTNFHELNLEWILLALKEIQQTMEDFVSLNAIKYADPIQWNITRQYEKNTIVIDPLTGTAYISVRPVPSGAAITDEDYWTVVFDLGQFVVKMAQNLANVVESETTLTATVSSSYNDWIIWGDVLYRNINPSGIVAGDAYVIGSNISAFTVEDVVGHIEDLTTSDKSNLVAAINEVLQMLVDTTGDLNDLATTDKSNLVAAINEVLQMLVDTTGDLNDLVTTDKSNLVAAINETTNNTINNTQRLNNLRIFSIYEYGGVGDGVTNDTQAINDLFNAVANNNGGIAYFPKGAYLFNEVMIVKSNTTVICDAGAVFKLDTANLGTFPRVVRFGDALDSPTAYNGAHDIVWDGGTFDMGFDDQFSSVNHMGVCMVLWHNKDITIKNVTFMHTFNDHCIELNSSQNIVIDSCIFKDCYVDSSLESTAYNYEAINTDWSTSTNAYGGAYDSTPLKDIIISNCHFDNLNVGIGSHGFETARHTNIKVLNCTFANMRAAAIHAMAWEYSLINNCNFTGATNNNSLAMVQLDHSFTNKILFNQFLNVTQDDTVKVTIGVKSGSNYPSYNTEVSFNTFRGSSGNNTVDYDTCWRGAIVNNQFVNNDTVPIKLGTAGTIDIASNIFDASPQSGTNPIILFDVSVNQCAVHDNIHANNPAPTYDVEKTTGITAKNNIIHAIYNSNSSSVTNLIDTENVIDGCKTLWSGNTNSGTITLGDNVSKYKSLMICTGGSSAYEWHEIRGWMTYSALHTGYSFTYISAGGTNNITITDSTTLTINTASDDIRAVIGITE